MELEERTGEQESLVVVPMSRDLAERRVRTLQRARVLLVRLVNHEADEIDVRVLERTRQELWALAQQIEAARR